MSYLDLEQALAHGFGRRYAQLREAWAMEAVGLKLREAAQQRETPLRPGFHGGPVDPHTTAVIVNAAEAAAG